MAVVLREGDRRDWAALSPAGLTAAAAGLNPSLCAAWTRYAEGEERMADARDRVMDAEQRHVLRVASLVLPAEGYQLVGGTALAAAYLGHRRSADLDLFTGLQDIRSGLEALTTALRQAGHEVQTEPHHTGHTFARLFVGRRPVKVELASDSPFLLRTTNRTVEGMPVRSLEDLAADKTLALFGRAVARDFVDVYFLLRTHFDWGDLLAFARQKDPGFSEEWFIRALQQVDRVDPSGVELLQPLDVEDLRRVFVEQGQRMIRRAITGERGGTPQ